jgi:vacuolar-type H+-ATPase subunit D/Vma8
VKVTLYSILGKKILKASFHSNGIQDIIIPKLKKSIYIIELKTQLGTLHKKLILGL